jgi:hypothetical protein
MLIPIMPKYQTIELPVGKPSSLAADVYIVTITKDSTKFSIFRPEGRKPRPNGPKTGLNEDLQSPNHPITQSPNYPIPQSPNHPIPQSPNPPITLIIQQLPQITGGTFAEGDFAPIF